MEQHDDLLQVHTGVGMAFTLDTKRTSGVPPREGGSLNLHPVKVALVYKTVALRTISTSWQLEDLFVHTHMKIDPL